MTDGRQVASSMKRPLEQRRWALAAIGARHQLISSVDRDTKEPFIPLLEDDMLC